MTKRPAEPVDELSAFSAYTERILLPKLIPQSYSL